VWSIRQWSPGSGYAAGMAEAAQTESVPARLAEIREQLKLLSDYL
jgi:hypothetical protein